MNEILNKGLEEIYTNCMSIPNTIVNIFNDFFGEHRVDMQDFINIEDFKKTISDVYIGFLVPSYDPWEDKKLKDFDNAELLEVLNLLDNSISTILDKYFRNIKILIHFPKVRITNEYDKFVDIENLYAKINFNGNGTINGFFTLNRSSYEYKHMLGNYMHSHICDIPFHNFEAFQTPCLGSGPIKHTLYSLNRSYNVDLWNLLCFELDKYVQVESIAGVPYHRLESIGANNYYTETVEYSAINSIQYLSLDFRHMIRDFMKHLISTKKLKFNYVSGCYCLSLSFIEYAILVSNEFIDWYNSKYNSRIYTYTYSTLLSKNILLECIIDNNKIYYKRENVRNIQLSEYIGKKVCVFKGKDVCINITDEYNTEDNYSIILSTNILRYIATKILKILNYEYKHTDCFNSTSDTTDKKRKYL